jgi:hypothetical protein
MQMGFNNDVDYKGLVVHIQTEDQGLKTKKITSQVFIGGAILESKTISYEKSIATYTDDASRDERIRTLMKALHRKFYLRIHEGLYDESLPIGEERVFAAHLTVKHDDDEPALSTPDVHIGEEGFGVAGAQAEMAAEYAANSRGEPLDDFEPAQLVDVAAHTAAAAESMDAAGFVPAGGLGAAAALSTAAPSNRGVPVIYSDQPAFRGLDVSEESLGAVILEAVYSQ